MATTITFNGSNYSVPAYGDSGWAQGAGNLSSYLIAISNGCLQTTGGTFTLSAEVDFGATYGLKSAYFKSETTTPSTTGVLRLAKTDAIGWRNNAGGADILLAKDTSDRLTYNGVPIVSSSGIVPVTAGGTGVATLTAHGVLIGEGTSNVAVTTAGNSGAALLSGGASADPAFGAIALGGGSNVVSGTLPVGNGGTNSATALSGSTIMVSNGSAIVQGTAGTSTTVLHGNASGTPTYAAVSLTADVSGTLPVGNGGTGAATLTAHGVLLGQTTSAIVATAAGSSGAPLLSGGASADPAFGAINLAGGATVLTGVLPNANTTAASANTASAIVARDGSGNFTAGTITAALTGNASTATDLSATAFSTYTPTWTGFTASPSATAYYKQIGKMVTLIMPSGMSGTSNSTSMAVTLPVAAKTSADIVIAGDEVDNGSRAGCTGSALVRTTATSSSLSIFKDWTGASWTNSGAKAFQSFIFIYEAN